MPIGQSSLLSDLDVEIEPDAEIGAGTWYGIGGRADLLVRPRTTEALETLAQRCSRTGTALRILGAGANLLVADEGVDGVVVKLDTDHFRRTIFEEGPEARCRAMAGADLPRAVMDAARRGLGGLEALAGIPATIGGATVMNAGGAFGAIGDLVEQVTCITRHGRRVTYPADELRFDYRRTNIPDPIVLAATLRLEETDPVALRERVKEIFAYKKSTQPLAENSAGCSFRNPIDPTTDERVPAARLIDEAGLKGHRVGGASVSTHHANFIVTDPGATARDVIALMDEVVRRVFDASGLELEREVVVWRRGEESP